MSSVEVLNQTVLQFRNRLSQTRLDDGSSWRCRGRSGAGGSVGSGGGRLGNRNCPRWLRGRSRPCHCLCCHCCNERNLTSSRPRRGGVPIFAFDYWVCRRGWSGIRRAVSARLLSSELRASGSWWRSIPWQLRWCWRLRDNSRRGCNGSRLTRRRCGYSIWLNRTCWLTWLGLLRCLRLLLLLLWLQLRLRLLQRFCLLLLQLL